MSLTEFLSKHKGAEAPISKYVKNGVSELHTKLNDETRHPPEHIDSQLELITDLFDTQETVWLFFFDAGRYDMFEQLVWDYFDGDLKRCYNGGVGYTGDWAVRHLSQDFGNRGLFSWVPLRGLVDVSYDGRNWFDTVPDIQSEKDTQEQLAALGYAERTTEETFDISPQYVNRSVREHSDEINGGVVRYLKPHPPFEGLGEVTRESTKTIKTKQALEDKQLTYSELTHAYRETYEIAFEHAVELIPDLNGKVILTADHGTCLTCGQLFHGRRLDKHDHLTHVPWFEVDQVL